MGTTDRSIRSTDAERSDVVRIVGDRPLSLPTDVGVAERIVGTSEERTIAFPCLSGRTIRGTWRGIPVSSLLERAVIPESTTHLRIEAVDGHAVCLDVLSATTALLALEVIKASRTDRTGTGLPRIVGPDLDGPQSVKRVAHIDPVQLDPAESPSMYEQLEPGPEIAVDGDRG